MFKFLFIILIILVANFLLDIFILHVSAKLLRAKHVQIKNTVIINALLWLTGLIASLIFLGLSFINLTIAELSALLLVIAFFVIFHKLLKKFYGTTIKKNIAIIVIFIILTSLISGVAVSSIRKHVVSPFRFVGSSMTPIINNNDFFIIKLFEKNYDRGDIVVYKNPKDESQIFIHRIIGLPNEKIEIKNGSVYIYNDTYPDGQKLEESYLVDESSTFMKQAIGWPQTIDEDQYYILGDNRNKSNDSRYNGPINKDLIIGKYWLKLYP